MLKLMIPWRLFLYVAITFFVTGVVVAQQNLQPHPEVQAMVKLLDYRDPVTGAALEVDVDESLPGYMRVEQMLLVEELEFWGRGFTELPSEIGYLRELEILRLRNTSIQTLPPEIGNLTSLRVLDAYDADLQSIPPEIGHLTDLRRLDLARNNIKSLPTEMENLDKLLFLSIAFNPQLEAVPPFILELSSLYSLHVDSYTESLLPTTAQQNRVLGIWNLERQN